MIEESTVFELVSKAPESADVVSLTKIESMEDATASELLDVVSLTQIESVEEATASELLDVVSLTQNGVCECINRRGRRRFGIDEIHGRCFSIDQLRVSDGSDRLGTR